ncbi:MAG: peptide chain release factor N(5)-glutamine methyltransferase [Bdellovibrio sp.]|nr:peptide chain release factor N(5)-glutamine methyltransferase [Methylotenera sp.]
MTNAHSIKSTLLLAAVQLKAQGIQAETAKLEAQLLLQHVLNINRAWLIAHENDALQPNIYEAYRTMLQRRLNGEPIAYILGYREFYGLKLKVTPATLIPRPDTETLVEAALARIPIMVRQAHHERDLSAPVRPELVEGQQNDSSSSPSFSRKWESMLNLNQKMGSHFGGNDEVNDANNTREGTQACEFSVLDLGTGTGAIALAIAKHRPQVNVTALDASQAALDIAIENTQNLNISNVKFILSDWFSALNHQNIAQKFDVIVSNPPYIESDDAHLKQSDLRFEPISALASGADGLDDIRTIIKQAKNHLILHGCLLLEHGYNQAEAVAHLLTQAGFNEVETIKDLSGNNRVTLGKIS